MPFVLDASLALNWAFQDEATPDSQSLLDSARDGELIYVPAHWPAEVLNGLIRAVRRGRLDEHSMEAFLQALQTFRISVDNRASPRWWIDTLEITRTYPISAYDAAYLSLALELGIRLATQDGQLRTAAIIAGLDVSPK